MIETCRRYYHHFASVLQALEHFTTTLAQRQSARLITWRITGSKPVGGINRCGAEVAREAHNLEVIGSNPIAGIFTSRVL